MDRVGSADSYTDLPDYQEGEEGSVDVVGLVQTLLRERRFIAATTCTFFVIATAIAFLLPLRYTSTVSFIPPSLNNSNSMASALAGQLSAFGAGELIGGMKNSGDLYAGILRSRSISSELVKKFDLVHVYKVKKESQAEKELDAATGVTVDAKSTIVTVEVTDKSPERAQQLASAYMDALQETNGRLALSQAAQRRFFFDKQLAKEKNDLEDAEVELKKTEEQSGLIAPSGQTEAEIRSLADMQAQIAVRQVQLAALRQSATEENPEVIRLKSEVADLQGQLANLQKGSHADSPVAIPTARVPELQLEYVRKEREVKYHEALFEMLSRQDEAAKLDEARDSPAPQVLDPASYPDSKSTPKRSYYMVGGLALGLFASCAWVLVRARAHGFLAAVAEQRPD